MEGAGGTLSRTELRDTLQWVNDQGQAVRRRVSEAVRRSGPCALEILGNARARVVVGSNGGESLDDLVRAVDDTNVDIDDAGEWVSRNLGDVDSRRQVMEVIDRTDGDAVELLDDLDDPATVRRLFDNDELDTDEIVTATGRYQDLDPDYQEQFTDVLRDTDADISWMQVVSSEDIDTSEIETALDRVQINSEHSVVDFEIGRNANPADAAHPPHDPDSIVVEIELEEGDEFWRVYERQPETDDPDENLDGGFLTRRSTLDSARSPEGVLNRLALLRSEFQDYNYVGRVDVTDEFVENHQIRVLVSTTRRQESDVSDEVRPGGGTQYILQDDLDRDAEGVNWEAVDELDEFVD